MSAVFYVDEDNFIATYRAQEQQERVKSDGGKRYVERFVYPVGANENTDKPLKAGGPDLAAISYYDDVGKQVCVSHPKSPQLCDE